MKEYKENYVFKGFGFPVVLPVAVFHTNSRGVKVLDVDMEELKDKVAHTILIWSYALTGSMLHFVRNYLEFSTIRMAHLLNVSQQTITNWEKKKNDALPLSEAQRALLLGKLKIYYCDKIELSILKAQIESKESINEVNLEPLIIEDIHLVS